jgi:putative intracellular protease/amidase
MTPKNLSAAQILSDTIGKEQHWCVKSDKYGWFICADYDAIYAPHGNWRARQLTDEKAIRLARAAGVICDDDGTIN